MTFAVISDIHGNLEAFTAVLADIRAHGVDQIISLGDNIGYGADSEAVIRIIRERGIRSVLGNHEMAVCQEKAIRWFQPDAAKALEIAMASLSEESRAFIRSLPASIDMGKHHFVHGFPPDSTRIYLYHVGISQLIEAFTRMEAAICFIGHTHELRVIHPQGQDVHSRSLTEGIIFLEPDRKYIINAGSVGQPRDGNAFAKYLIWNAEMEQLITRFIPYDVDAAARKIAAAGIPDKYVRCLQGVPTI